MYKQTKERHSCRKEVEEQTYKEFIRQRVLKYQHQSPRMTEFEIYQKIGREWQAFNLKQKQQLYSMYVNNRFISPQPKLKEQFQSIKQIQNKNKRQNHVKQVQGQKNFKLEETSNIFRTTRAKLKQSSQNKSLKKQQMIDQKTLETIKQSSSYLQLGQNLSKKLKQLDRSNQQSVNLYKEVLQQVQKAHKKVTNIFKKEHIPFDFPIKIEETTKKLTETKKSLRKIEQQPAEQESSQLSPQEHFKLKQQIIKSNNQDSRQNQRLKLAVKLKMEQSINKNPILAKCITQRSPYLSIKLQQKPKLPKKTNEYLQFYKKGYKKLKQSCSFLSAFEITKILTNLWHKKKAVQKLSLKNNRQKSIMFRDTPPEKKIQISSMLARKIGKINFIKSKLKEEYLPQQAHQLWKILPLQTKIKWTYPEHSLNQRFIQKQQRPLTGAVRLKSNKQSETHLYDLDWDIFDEINHEQFFSHAQEQSKLQKQ